MGKDSNLMGDPLGKPSSTGMGSEIDIVYRQYNTVVVAQMEVVNLDKLGSRSE